jgi:hypothetical protein
MLLRLAPIVALLALCAQRAEAGTCGSYWHSGRTTECGSAFVYPNRCAAVRGTYNRRGGCSGSSNSCCSSTNDCCRESHQLPHVYLVMVALSLFLCVWFGCFRAIARWDPLLKARRNPNEQLHGCGRKHPRWLLLHLSLPQHLPRAVNALHLLPQRAIFLANRVFPDDYKLEHLGLRSQLCHQLVPRLCQRVYCPMLS